MEPLAQSNFWYYLGSFIGYTLLAIAAMYGMFLALKKNPKLLSFLMKKPTPDANVPLCIETSLPLEPRKNLYIIRAGQERFLVATSTEGTQFLSRLDSSDTPPGTPSTSPSQAQAASLSQAALSPIGHSSSPSSDATPSGIADPMASSRI